MSRPKGRQRRAGRRPSDRTKPGTHSPKKRRGRPGSDALKLSKLVPMEITRKEKIGRPERSSVRSAFEKLAGWISRSWTPGRRGQR